MIETILKGLAIAPKGKSELIDRAKEKTTGETVNLEIPIIQYA